MIGQTISHYKILEKLGEGGMGVVYKAHDTKLDRDVALKSLPHQLTASGEEKARFVQEARAAAALNHPNICTIHEFLEADDPATNQRQAFIVMELVKGRSLREMLPVVTFKQAADIGAQIAAGLASAHKHEIVHRDIKPENIMVREDGRALIMDFGLAKLKGSATLTKTHTTVGTAQYMSPEQAQGEKVDHRSDIFSLGVVLYELFTGHPPFTGEHEAAVIYEIVNVGPQSPSTQKPGIPSDLDSLIMDCLAKDPESRCQSAAEIGRRLRMLGSGSRAKAGTQIAAATGSEIAQTGSRPEGRSRKGTMLLRWGVAAVFICTTVLFGVLYFTRHLPGVDLSRYSFTPFAIDSEPEDGGAWAPDGKSIAYVKEINGSRQLFVKNIAPNALPTQLTMAGGVYRPFWSPKADLVYFIREGSVWSVGTAGGEPRMVLEGRKDLIVDHATLSPDGTLLAVWARSMAAARDSSSPADSVQSASLWVSSPSGSPPRRYEPSPFELKPSLSNVSLHFSPDGSMVAASIYRPGGSTAATWLIPMPGGKNAAPRQVSWETEFSIPQHIDWFPDSRSLVLCKGNLIWLGDTRTGRRFLIGRSLESWGDPSVSPDGSKILFTSGSVDFDIVEVPLSGTQPHTIISSSLPESNPSWSSKGDRMAYITTRSGHVTVWLRNAKEDLRPVVTGADFPDDFTTTISRMMLSPDGKRIAYTRNGRQKGSQVWISTAEGGRPTLLFDEQSFCSPCWSPDGDEIAALIVRERIPTLVVKRIGGQDTGRAIWQGDISTVPVWSPKGDWIAFGTEDGITLVSPASRQTKGLKSPVPVDKQDYSLTWTPDGSSLYILSSTGDESRLDILDIGTGASRKIAGYGHSVVFGNQYFRGMLASLSPDGKSLVTSARVVKSGLWIMEGFPEPEKLW